MSEINEIIEKIDHLKNGILDTLLYGHRVSIELTQRSIVESADYAEKNMPNLVLFTSNVKSDMWNYALDKRKNDGYIAEFGVWQGESINYLANKVHPKPVFGFDSFLGLSEDFVLDCPKGKFSLDGIPPVVSSNVTLVPGFFSDTLPNWLENNSGIFSLLNIDCDTYESTSFVLNSIGPDRIVSGTLIIFDEYFGFYGWKDCEFKAWQEYCKINNIKYKYLATCHLQVLIEVL